MKLVTYAGMKTEIALTSAVGARLVATLDTYHELVAQKKMLEAQIDLEREAIGQMVESTGYESLAIAKSKITLVRGTTSSLDQKKLITQGVTLAMLEAATTVKPKKPYWKISGESDE